MRKISIFIIGILALALLAGCRGNPELLPTDGPGGPPVDLPAPVSDGDGTPVEDCDLVEYGVAGDILSINASDNPDILGTIEVKGEPDNGAMYDYATVTVTADTEIYGNDTTSFDDLETGMYVTVFFDGAVAESYPVQGRAAQVNVVVNEEPVEE